MNLCHESITVYPLFELLSEQNSRGRSLAGPFPPPRDAFTLAFRRISQASGSSQLAGKFLTVDGEPFSLGNLRRRANFVDLKWRR